MRKRTLLIVLSQLLLTVPLLIAEEPAGFSGVFQEALDAWINGEIDSELLFDEMSGLEAILEREDESWENLYWRSRIAIVRGRIHYEREDEQSSLIELKRTQELAQESIDVQDNSDSWRIMSEASSLIMLQRGIGYTILNFSKGQHQYRRSLELDPDNARASLLHAQFLCNAPGLFGGNPEEGIKVLRDLSIRADLIKEDRFSILLALSEALEENQQIDEAIVACRKAIAVFPGNQDGQSLLVDLLSR